MREHRRYQSLCEKLRAGGAQACKPRTQPCLVGESLWEKQERRGESACPTRGPKGLAGVLTAPLQLTPAPRSVRRASRGACSVPRATQGACRVRRAARGACPASRDVRVPSLPRLRLEKHQDRSRGQGLAGRPPPPGSPEILGRLRRAAVLSDSWI